MMSDHMMGIFFDTKDYNTFCANIQNLIHLVKPGGTFAGDNLLTYGRNLGFLDDNRFMQAFRQHAITDVEKALIWRYHIQCWAATRAMNVAGDLVECACYKGISARILADYVDLNASEKSFYLYDLFEHNDAMPHHEMPEHSIDLFEQVNARFTGFQNVIVTKGAVPQILHEVAPEKIAYLHLDLNNTEAELGALDFFWDRITPGGSVVFDDYGWRAYRSQKLAEDTFLSAHGYQVLELPTGQGLLIK